VVGRNHTGGRGIRFAADARSADIYLGTMKDKKEGQWETNLSGCDCRIIDIFKNECNFEKTFWRGRLVRVDIAISGLTGLRTMGCMVTWGCIPFETSVSYSSRCGQFHLKFKEHSLCFSGRINRNCIASRPHLCV